MLEELLLVCTYVGARVPSAKGKRDDSDSDSESVASEMRFVKGEDFVAWLQDLHRVLHRDQGSDEQSVRQTLGAWKVLETKLLPIVEESAGDDEAVRTLMRIFLLWTMQLKPRAVEALAIRPPQKKTAPRGKKGKENTDEDLLHGTGVEKKKMVVPLEQKETDTLGTLREAATQQVKCLAEARQAFASSKKFLRVLLGSFRSALEKDERTSQDVEDLELAMCFLRNLTRPLPVTFVDSIDSLAKKSFDRCAAALHDELFFDVLAELGCAVKLKENQDLSLLLVEIYAHLFCDGGHAPADVARAGPLHSSSSSSNKKSTSDDDEEEEEEDEGPPPAERGALAKALRREQLGRKGVASGRHSRFGALIQKGSTSIKSQTSLASRAALEGGADVASGLSRSNAIVKRGLHPFLSDDDLDRQKKTARRRKKVDDCRGEGDDPALDFDDEYDDDDDPAANLVPRGSRRDDILRVAATSRVGVDARREFFCFFVFKNVE